jgi:hypothetical protein
VVYDEDDDHDECEVDSLDEISLEIICHPERM